MSTGEQRAIELPDSSFYIVPWDLEYGHDFDAYRIRYDGTRLYVTAETKHTIDQVDQQCRHCSDGVLWRTE